MGWRIENRKAFMEMKTSEVGRSVQTPGYGGDFYPSDQFYKSTLLLPRASKLSSIMGSQHDKSLVIEIETITREEECWQEDVQYGSKYKLSSYMEEKTWEDAEAHCQSLGGHLASVRTAEEHEELASLAGWMIGVRSLKVMEKDSTV